MVEESRYSTPTSGLASPIGTSKFRRRCSLDARAAVSRVDGTAETREDIGQPRRCPFGRLHPGVVCRRGILLRVSSPLTKFLFEIRHGVSHFSVEALRLPLVQKLLVGGRISTAGGFLPLGGFLVEPLSDPQLEHITSLTLLATQFMTLNLSL